MIITPKGEVKHDKLLTKSYLRPEERLNMWVFTTLSKYSDLNQEFLITYLQRGSSNWDTAIETTDFFWNMVNMEEIREGQV